MEPRKVEGTIAGVIASIFLWLPVCWYLYMIAVPPSPSYYEYMPPMAGTLIFFFILGSNTVGVILVGLTKMLLKRSTVFGALFILSGLLNLYLLISMFSFPFFSGLVGILLYTPPLVPILVGVSLVKPLRELVYQLIPKEGTKPSKTSILVLGFRD